MAAIAFLAVSGQTAGEASFAENPLSSHSSYRNSSSDVDPLDSSVAKKVAREHVARKVIKTGNPFTNRILYVNPSYAASLDTSVSTAGGQTRATLQEMKIVPSAYWLDRKAKILGNGTRTMEGILADSAAKSPPHLVTFVIYDLPNRDCFAKASYGEICCTYNKSGGCDYLAPGNCTMGLAEYKSDYIDKIVGVLKRYASLVPIVLVIEPDSLPNLVTNKADLRCGNRATVKAYTHGVTYAIQSIAVAVPQVTMYLDAGHGGWLGWTKQMGDFVALVRNLHVVRHLRGFTTNVAGYQPLGSMCPSYDWCLRNSSRGDSCCTDPCNLTQESNPSHNEANFALHLRKAMSEGISGFRPHIIIDTGRNGVVNLRQNCSNWCNIRGAGVGVRPTTDTVDPAVIDAYFWLKTPGESDGCSEILPNGTRCLRFDSDCASPESLGTLPVEPPAPEAGHWFDYQVKQLAENANTSRA